MRGCKAADCPCKALKIFDGSLVYCMWSMNLLGSLGYFPWKHFLNFGALRVHLLAIHISAQLTESALRWVLQLANYVIRTTRLAQRVTAVSILWAWWLNICAQYYFTLNISAIAQCIFGTQFVSVTQSSALWTLYINSFPPIKVPCHRKICLQVTIMWHALLVCG